SEEEVAVKRELYDKLCDNDTQLCECEDKLLGLKMSLKKLQDVLQSSKTGNDDIFEQIGEDDILKTKDQKILLMQFALSVAEDYDPPTDK
ncbi:hypothetical protein V2J09_004055, partial [Rumex salicifolius]